MSGVKSRCPHCLRLVALQEDGKFRKHGRGQRRTPGFLTTLARDEADSCLGSEKSPTECVAHG